MNPDLPDPTYPHLDDARADSIREAQVDHDETHGLLRERPPFPTSDTAREAAEHIHQQYRSAIKVLFDADPYKNGDNTIRLLTERIQTAIDASTAALRREVEGLKRHADKSLDALAERDREVFALTTQLAEVTKERDAVIAVFNAIGEAIGPHTLEADSLMMNPGQRAVAAILQIKEQRDKALARAEGLRNYLKGIADRCANYPHDNSFVYNIGLDAQDAIDAAGGTEG